MDIRRPHEDQALPSSPPLPDQDRAYEALLEIFVKPFYSLLLHANFLRSEESCEHFHAHLALAARASSTVHLRLLLDDEDWRPRLAAAWFIAIVRRKGFAERIIACLGQSRGSYDEQGFCVALGLLGCERSKAALRNYLRNADAAHPDWALGALAHADGAMGLRSRQHDAHDPVGGASERFAEIAGYLHRVELLLVDTKSN